MNQQDENNSDHGPERAEYTADQKQKKALNVLTFWIVLSVSVLAVFSVLNTIHATQVATQDDEQIVEAQLDVCETSRSIIYELIQTEKTRTQKTDPANFPDIPRREFQRLVNEKVRDLRNLQDTIPPDFCDTKFDPLS